MANESKPQADPSNRHRTEKLSKEEIDKLVQGVHDIYFGGQDEVPDDKSSTPDKQTDETPKSGDDAE